ncbi:hypothetical protein Droror1_Dr00006005 [Drosera rotundifolia]
MVVGYFGGELAHQYGDEQTPKDPNFTPDSTNHTLKTKGGEFAERGGERLSADRESEREAGVLAEEESAERASGLPWVVDVGEIGGCRGLFDVGCRLVMGIVEGWLV